MDPLLLALLGPTGSGKTALSLSLARRFHGEVVSCDSVAVYREMELGTAKPSPEARQEIPHHLIDILPPNEPCTAGDYSRLARQALGEIVARGRLPIVTGGTGLYLRALLEGLFAGPQRCEELRDRLRASAQRRAPGWLHRVLRRLDPAAAGRIHPNDEPKLIRAIEVCLAARQPLTQAWEGGRDPLRGYCILRIGLDPPRAELYARIEGRAEQMFAEGLVEETRGAAPEVWGDAAGLRCSGLSAGARCSERREHGDRSRGRHAPGPSQLCQATDDLVSPRARCALAARLRR